MRLGTSAMTLGLAMCAMLLLAPTISRAGMEKLAFRQVSLDLPGPPAKIIPTDLDGDGRTDLLVVLAYTEIEEIDADRIENMIHITTVIPAVFDRREVRAYLATSDGRFAQAGEALALPPSVLHMEPGPPGVGIVALTDDGLSRLRLAPTDGKPALVLQPLIEEPPVLAHTRSFYSSLKLVRDLDGDGVEDVLLPGAEHLSVYLGTASGMARTPAATIDLFNDERRSSGRVSRRYPWPTVGDVNGDGLPDLVFDGALTERRHWGVHVLLGAGGGRFRTLRSEALDCHDRLTDLRKAVTDPTHWPWLDEEATFRDLDGDGRAELVSSTERARGDSWRKELKDAKKPIQAFEFYRLKDDLFLETEPYFEMQVVGHTMEGEPGEEERPFWVRQFEDLDGDGREDLVTITLKFSIFQVVRIMTTKKISVGIDFHVYAQLPDGRFKEVSGLDLSEKLKFDLNNLKIGRFAQFAGDFDGDGRKDFTHLGRGHLVTVHAGQPGCRYPKKPDLSIDIVEEPASIDLVQIEDLDGDGRSDIRITRPMPPTDVDTTAPIRLDFYFSGGPS